MARETYTLNGATEFSFPHRVRVKGLLTVEVRPGGVVPPTAYSVIGAGPNSTGVTVVYPGAPFDPTLELVITRYTPASRLTVFQQGNVTPNALNAEFDHAYDALGDFAERYGSWGGVWATGTLYDAMTSVRHPTTGSVYVAVLDHQAGADFDTDIAAGKWRLVVDFSDFSTAKDAAETAATAAAGSATAAAGSATAAAGSATAAEADADRAETAMSTISATLVETITPASDANVTLTSAQNAADVRVLTTGAWTQGRSLICDDVSRQFVLVNSGTYDATVTTSGTTPTTTTVKAGNSANIIVRAGVGASVVTPSPTSGTYVPQLRFGGSSTGITYTSRGATYVKKYVGGGLSEVFVQVYMALSNKGSPTGIVSATLPFTVYVGGSFPVPTFRLGWVTYTGQTAAIGGSGAVVSFQQITEAGTVTDLTNTNFANNSEIIFSMTYLTED